MMRLFTYAVSCNELERSNVKAPPLKTHSLECVRRRPILMELVSTLCSYYLLIAEQRLKLKAQRNGGIKWIFASLKYTDDLQHFACKYLFRHLYYGQIS